MVNFCHRRAEQPLLLLSVGNYGGSSRPTGRKVEADPCPLLAPTEPGGGSQVRTPRLPPVSPPPGFKTMGGGRGGGPARQGKHRAQYPASIFGFGHLGLLLPTHPSHNHLGLFLPWRKDRKQEMRWVVGRGGTLGPTFSFLSLSGPFSLLWGSRARGQCAAVGQGLSSSCCSPEGNSYNGGDESRMFLPAGLDQPQGLPLFLPHLP